MASRATARGLGEAAAGEEGLARAIEERLGARCARRARMRWGQVVEAVGVLAVVMGGPRSLQGGDDLCQCEVQAGGEGRGEGRIAQQAEGAAQGVGGAE